MKNLHDFMRGRFYKTIGRKHRAEEIRTEGDLQAHSWLLLSRFLAKANPKMRFQVLNKWRWGKARIYPDLVILKRERPWVLVELKWFQNVESGRTQRRIAAERKKLVRAVNSTRTIKRTYFVCLFTRKGEESFRRIGKKLFEIRIARNR